MKTILITSTSFPSYREDLKNKKRGGADFMKDDCDILMKAGYRIVVLMPVKVGLNELEESGSITIHRFKYPMYKLSNSYKQKPIYKGIGLFEFISLLFLFSYFIVNVGRIIKKYNPDIIWANWLQIAFVTQLSNRGRKKLMLSVRGTDYREMPKWLVRLQLFKTKYAFNPFPGVEKIENFNRKFGLKQIVVPAGYIPRPFPKRIAAKRFRISVIGRLHEEKQVYKIKGLGLPLIEILAELLSSRDDFEVIIIGTGTSEEKYKRLLERYDERVVFTGWLDNFDKYLASSDLVFGGAGLNGLVKDGAPYGVPYAISKYNVERIWKDRENCLVFDPFEKYTIVEMIDWAIDNRGRTIEYALQAQVDIKQFLKPVDEAVESWKESIDSIE